MVKRVSEIPRKGDTLADRLNYSVRGNQWLSGRGHGRVTSHGRGSNDKKIFESYTQPQPKSKRNMLYFVRDFVKMYRLAPDVYLGKKSNGEPRGTAALANIFAKWAQYFDCDEIYQYILENIWNVFPDEDTPPSEDVILPSECVGLYFSDMEEKGRLESLFLCTPVKITGDDDKDRRHFSIMWLPRTPMRVLEGEVPVPETIAIIDANNGTIENKYSVEGFKGIGWEESDVHVMHYYMIRKVCIALQTINQPRFVINQAKPFSASKRYMAKKVLGRFTPDSWNMVTWNVGEPIKAKEHEEGSGGKQALHFRRGHPRLAEKHWARAYWSTIRNRYEQYIHGYEAGHPAFGVKKNYHLPRKDI